MLAEKDPIIMELYARYQNLPMPNMRLNEVEVAALIKYMDTESLRVEKENTKPGACCEIDEPASVPPGESPRNGLSTASVIFSSALCCAVLLLAAAVFGRRLARFDVRKIRGE